MSVLIRVYYILRSTFPTIRNPIQLSNHFIALMLFLSAPPIKRSTMDVVYVNLNTYY